MPFFGDSCVEAIKIEAELQSTENGDAQCAANLFGGVDDAGGLSLIGVIN
jgi:hypothetical protein